MSNPSPSSVNDVSNHLSAVKIDEDELVLDESDKWRDALENIQESSCSLLISSAIERPVMYRYQRLPQEVQRSINIIHSQYYGLFNERKQGDEGETQFLEMMKVMQTADFFDSFRTKPYHLWPVNLGIHWICFFIHMGARDKTSDQYDTVAHYAVYDSLPKTQTTQLLSERLTLLFFHSGFSIATNARREIWCPTQKDGFSCGVRVVAFHWEILRRIEELHAAGKQYHRTLWNSVTEDFDEKAVRFEIQTQAKEALGLIPDVDHEIWKEAYRSPETKHLAPDEANGDLVDDDDDIWDVEYHRSPSKPAGGDDIWDKVYHNS